MRPGVSVAAVTLTHSLNANMLRKWFIHAQPSAASSSNFDGRTLSASAKRSRLSKVTFAR